MEMGVNLIVHLYKHEVRRDYVDIEAEGDAEFKNIPVMASRIKRASLRSDFSTLHDHSTAALLYVCERWTKNSAYICLDLLLQRENIQ